MPIRYFLILLLSCLVLKSTGQISSGGVPASFTHLKKASTCIPVIDMLPVKNDQLFKEEQQNPDHLKAFIFAKDFNVDISTSNSGVWDSSEEFKIWRVGIRSIGAYSLNLIFDKMIIPKGAALFVYSKDHEKLIGAFTSENEQASGDFATYPIAGDEIIVEYNEPLKTEFPGELHISTINHDYKSVFGSRPLGESGLCNMDVNCPDAIAYSTEKQAIVGLIIAGRELCTGTLVNNTKQDNTPYVITAAHCILNASDASKTIYYFNYESPLCGNGTSSVNGNADQSISGSALKARSDSLDFTLVQLSTTPPATFRPYFAGWNRSASIPTSSFAIHHPEGDVKKVTVDNNSPTIGTFGSNYVKNSFYIIGKWDIGTTEAGSSGCGFFNQNRQIVGSLTGGTATCSDPTNDLFSMFNKQWDYFKTSDKQLKVWLDPNNTGVTELTGLNPYNSTVSCSLLTNASPGEKYALQKMISPAKGYKGGHNSLKITSYAERFEKTDLTTISSVSFGVAKIASSSMNSNSKIVLKIYQDDSLTGLPGTELTSVDLPFSVLSDIKMNSITLTNPITIKNKYFIGYDVNYLNAADTFAIYTAPDRVQLNKNEAFAKIGGNWKPFYWIPEIGISSSLLIAVNGCENTFSTITNPVVNQSMKFAVLYPQTHSTDYILLQNNGTEEFASISLYDINGRKLFTEERMLSNLPGEVAMSQYHSGIYFLTVETAGGRQVIKIRLMHEPK